MVRRILLLCLFAATTAVFTACASSGGAGGAGNATVVFDIDNNLGGLAGVTVYLVRDSGSRRSLGLVQTGRRQAFTESVRPGTYTLLASGGPQGDLQSDRFRLETGEMAVAWDLRANVLRIGTR